MHESEEKHCLLVLERLADRRPTRRVEAQLGAQPESKELGGERDGRTMGFIPWTFT